MLRGEENSVKRAGERGETGEKRVSCPGLEREDGDERD